jgi:hypothetical protein
LAFYHLITIVGLVEHTLRGNHNEGDQLLKEVSATFINLAKNAQEFRDCPIKQKVNNLKPAEIPNPEVSGGGKKGILPSKYAEAVAAIGLQV